MDVTEAQRRRGKVGAQADSGAICQTTNAATAPLSPALRVAICRPVAASRRLDGGQAPPSPPLLATNPHIAITLHVINRF